MGQDEDEEEEEEAEAEEDEDPDVVGMTEDEIKLAKSYLKDRVKDQSQVLLDEARDSVIDTVSMHSVVSCYEVLLLCCSITSDGGCHVMVICHFFILEPRNIIFHT